MRKIIVLFSLTILVFLTASTLVAQVAINTDGSSPVASAMLDIQSTTKGLLAPRMTSAQRLIIASPATGLLVYQTDGSAGFYFYNGASWLWLGGSNHTGSGINGQVTFWTGTGSQSGSGNLFWDNANSRMGIGTSAPNQQLELTGNLRMPATSAVSGIIYSAGNPFIHNYGTYNNFFGINSGNLTLSGAFYNNAFGDSTLTGITDGDYNIAIGQGALKSVTTGMGNIGIGYRAGKEITTGGYNLLVGYYSGKIITSDANSFFGNSTGIQTTTGSSNTFVGQSSGQNNTTGSNNTFLGRWAGSTNTNGSTNTAVGNSADIGAAGLFNATAVGAGAIATASDQVRLGDNYITSLFCMGAYNGTTGSPANMVVDVNGQIMRSTASTVSGSGAATRIAFWSGAGTLSYNSILFWDNATSHLGIGTTMPSQQLELTGNLRMPATTATTGILYSDGNPFLQNYGTNNNFLGINAGNLTLSGAYGNAAFGDSTLTSVTSGDYNIAIGQGALKSATTANYNIGIGLRAGQDILSNSNNVLVGYSSGTFVAANNNTFLGSYTGNRTTTGSDNTFLGYSCGLYNISGNYNSFLGRSTGNANLYGSNNTAVGYSADFGANNLTNATAIGYNATATASDQVRLGDGNISTLFCMGAYNGTSASVPNLVADATGQIMRSTATLLSGAGAATRVAFWSGASSLSYNSNLYWDNTNSRLGLGTTTPGQQLELTGNIEMPATSPTSGIIYSGSSRYLHNFGTNNNFLGLLSGNLTLTTASRNDAIGDSSLISITSGSDNVAIGQGALKNLTYATDNVAIGTFAGKAMTSGSDNTFVGYRAGLVSVPLVAGNGTFNCFFGSFSGLFNTTGFANTFIGFSAGTGNTTGYQNTLIGDNADVSSGNLFNATALGKGAIVNTSNKVVIGNSSVGTIGGYAGWTNYSDRRLKENIRYTNDLGLDFIMKLKTVSYNYIKDENKRRRDGLIAQDVEKALGETGGQFSGLVIDDDKDKTMNLSYGELVLPLINAVQKQQEMISKLAEENRLLRERVEKLENK